jgi:uncharacterized protein (TIGR00661 family)
MRILYGVVGEGMGHAMRSRVVLDHLFAQGHRVEIVASGRAADFLQKRFGPQSDQRGADVNRIHGLHILYDENRVRRGMTLWSNVLSGTVAIPKQIAAYFSLIDDFRPELVISDFESWTYYYGKAHGLPVISIDNMQVINRCVIPDEVVEGHRADFEIAKAFVKSKLPFCAHYMITSFFRPTIRKERTSIHPPILRPEILAATRSRGEHLLVYQTAEGNDELAATLEATGIPCRVYGMRRSITEDQIEGHLTYRPFSEAGFISDLSSARAVIAGGGFTLLGEAVYLRKPTLSVPVHGQFEQVLNARYLEKLGYGRYAPSLSDPRAVHAFVADIDRCQEALEGYQQDGNADLLAALDGLLDRAAAGVL